jgi:hypothetical protein
VEREGIQNNKMIKIKTKPDKSGELFATILHF